MFEAAVAELYWVTVFFNNQTPPSPRWRRLSLVLIQDNAQQKQFLKKCCYVDSTYFVDLNVAYFVDELL